MGQLTDSDQFISVLAHSKLNSHHHSKPQTWTERFIQQLQLFVIDRTLYCAYYVLCFSSHKYFPNQCLTLQEPLGYMCKIDSAVTNECSIILLFAAD